MLFTITPTTSIFNPDGTAFSQDTAGADALTVAAGAFLIANSDTVVGIGAFLANTGPWTVSVNGLIFSELGSAIQFQTGGAILSTVTVGTQGHVHGATGIFSDKPVTIKNAGLILGTTNAGIVAIGAIGNPATIINSGTITGVTESIFAGNAILTNSGTLNGDLLLSGNNKVTNSGVVNGDIEFINGLNIVSNSKTINGGIIGGSSADKITNTGKITGTVDLKAGDDRFTGGKTPELVRDGDGNDTYNLGAGADIFLARGQTGLDGTDVVNGGTGRDTYAASDAPNSVVINLDAVAHDLTPISPGAGLVAARTASGSDISATFKDTIIGFENAAGGNGNDLIYGNASANILDGGEGGDNLLGFGGNDRLAGGGTSDGLAGGAGKDTLIGGLGGDVFQFFKLSDSGTKPASRDVITDFENDGAGGELIDIHFIDANTKIAGNNAFTFIGAAAFTGAAGQLRTTLTTAGQIITGDVNGDKKADFAIELIDPTHVITLSGTDAIDFLL